MIKMTLLIRPILQSLVLAALLCTSSLSVAAPNRPLILVPGILGSKLCTESNKVLWGGIDSYANLSQLEINPAKSQPLLHPCGIIDRIQVFGPLFSIHQYDSLLDTLKGFGYELEKNLFIFDYDWRQSNEDSAFALKKFIDAKIGDKRFDIVAHSMGGLVTRVYLARNGATSEVSKVIYLATPFKGSANTFGNLQGGWGIIQNQMAGGIDDIRRIVVSIPGFLELLPAYENCCYVRDATTSVAHAFDAFDPEVWRKNGWVDEETATTGYARFSENLSHAKSISKLVQGNVTNQFGDLQEVKIIGDFIDTKYRLGMLSNKVSFDGWLFSNARGDGTVSIWSAGNAAGGTISGSPSFSPHATVFDDRAAKVELERELTKLPPEIVAYPISKTGPPTITAMTATGQKILWPIDRVGTLTESSVSRNSSFKGSVVFEFTNDADVVKGLFIPLVSMTCGGQSATNPVAVKDVATDSDVAAHRLRFDFVFDAPATISMCDISTKATEELSAHQYVLVR